MRLEFTDFFTYFIVRAGDFIIKAPYGQSCGTQRSTPSRIPTTTLTVSLSRRKPHAEIGIAFSQSPLWDAETAVSLAV